MAITQASEEGLKISNAGTNGQYLQKQSGNTGGLTWANVNTDLVSDTSPQLGGELDSNGRDIKLTDGEKLLLHDHGSIGTKTAATNANGGYVLQNSMNLYGSIYDIWLNTTGKKITFGTSDSTAHEVMRVQCAAVGASQHGYVDLNYVVANAGGSASSANRLKTTETGITLTGDIIPATTQAHDLGSTSKKWSQVHADYFYGDGSNLTGITSTTINNNADNRIITGSGTANTLEGESALTFDGSLLKLQVDSGEFRVEAANGVDALSVDSDNGNTVIGGDLTIPDKIIHTGDTNTAVRFPSDDTFTIEIGGSEVFRADSNHRLGLRTSTVFDSNSINMSGTKAYSAGITQGQVAIYDGQAYNTTDNGGAIGFSAKYNSSNAVTQMAAIEGVKHNNDDGNYQGALVFKTRLNQGNSVVGMRLTDNGLCFGTDTAGANALDDYEEGTFTPQWQGGSALGTTSYGTTNLASYTKIGRLVTVTGRTDISSSSGGQGFWFCTNMPFNVNGGGKGFNAVGSVSIENHNFANDTTYITATMEQNNNNMHIHTVRDDAGLGTGVSPSNGGMTVQWTITYQTA